MTPAYCVLYFEYDHERVEWRACIELRNLPTVPQPGDFILAAGHRFHIEWRAFAADRIELHSHGVIPYAVDPDMLRREGWTVTTIEPPARAADR